MHVTIETPETTNARLLKVLQGASFHVVPGVWIFEEFNSVDFTAAVKVDALALVRDEDRWSQLTRAEHHSKGAMSVWSFHFPSEEDNSGFVGWLASNIKAATGSGVAVICGQNSQRGGIFDYWCCPLESKQAVLRLIDELRASR